MSQRELAISEYQGMWLFAMFDLPVTTPRHRKLYAHFRKHLLVEGFSMLQYSVYARYCANEELSTALRRRIGKALPHEGQVRLLLVTDRQFGKMEVFLGKKRQPTEQPPSQMLLF